MLKLSSTIYKTLLAILSICLLAQIFVLFQFYANGALKITHFLSPVSTLSAMLVLTLARRAQMKNK